MHGMSHLLGVDFGSGGLEPQGMISIPMHILSSWFRDYMLGHAYRSELHLHIFDQSHACGDLQQFALDHQNLRHHPSLTHHLPISLECKGVVTCPLYILRVA